MNIAPTLLLVVALSGATACISLRSSAPEPDFLAKIEFDLSTLDENGLIGPPNGKVLLAYEFAIPDTEACRAEVLSINPSIHLSKSRGRIGATAAQLLCIGETDPPDPVDVLHRLAALPYVERIIRCWYE